MLGFGETSYYLGYTAMTDFFPRYMMKPNPNCDNQRCCVASSNHQQWLKDNPQVQKEKKVEKKDSDFVNEYGIEIIDSSEPIDSSLLVQEGIMFAYDPQKEKANDGDVVNIDELKDLNSLMNELSLLSLK